MALKDLPVLEPWSVQSSWVRGVFVLVTVVGFLHASARPEGDILPVLSAAEQGTEECYTDGCNRTVSALMMSLNASADPCEDFFEFACGGYVKNTEMPPNMGGISVVGQMEDKLRMQLNELLSEPVREQEPDTFTKAKTLYRACTNTTLLDELGLEPARKLLTSIGGWPILEGDQWDESKFDWKEMMYKFHDSGLYGDFLFSLGITIDISNTTKYSIEVGMPDFNLDLKAFDELTTAMRLQEYIRQMTAGVELLSDPSTNFTHIAKNIKQIAMLEMDLNARTKSREDRHNVTLSMNLMNVSTLQLRYPYVPWMEYMSRMLPDGANLTESEVVIVSDTGYMDGLGEVLAQTPKRVLADYMVWRALESVVFPYLDQKARKVFVQGHAERLGRRGRWEECVKLLQLSMRMATSAMYVRRHSSEEARSTAREMVQDISKEMYRLLESVDWMDPSTRRAAMMKAEIMRYNVAFPDELLNDTVLDKYYSKVEVRADRLLESMLSLAKDARRRNAEKFHTSVKKQDWTYISGYADVVNAFYAHGENSLSIPAGILQGAFFQNDRPHYMNYGAIGFAIGHEVSHGFDETGGLFNMDGMLEDWWDQETKKRFDEKVRCIVNLYSKLKSKAINATVNGVLTQSENIADNAALKLAYRAYRRFTARRGPEPRVVLRVPTAEASTSNALPALPEAPAEALAEAWPTTGPGDQSTLILKPRQLFWVSFASVWCSKESPKELNRKLRASTHLPGIHRVNGAVRNQEAFAADFNCPVGSPMNPAHKCQVW